MKTFTQIVKDLPLVDYIEQGRWDLVKKAIKVVYDQRVGIYPDQVVRELCEQEGIEWR